MREAEALSAADENAGKVLADAVERRGVVPLDKVQCFINAIEV
jgi:hypothetical protein